MTEQNTPVRARRSAPSAAVAAGVVLVPDPEKLALAWTHTARFLTTASLLNQLPQSELPEVAFVGRSNAGSRRPSM